MDKWTKIAWQSLAYSGDIIFGALTLFWLLAYISEPELQLVYYKAIVWLMPTSWVLALWIDIAFIIGAA